MEEIAIEDFQKIDIRIGTITKAEVPEWSHWVMKLTVDFGDPPAGGGEKIIFSGIMKFFKPQDLEGKQFPFVVNLKPKKIGPDGDFSQGMMIMPCPAEAESEGGRPEEEVAPVLFNLSQKVPNGTKVR